MAKRGQRAAHADDATEAALDRLFDAPLDAFLATRKAIAAELKAAGAKDAAAKVLAVHKPTPTAWAINRVARGHGDALARFREAAIAHADAMTKRDPGALRKAMREVSARHAEALARAKEAFAATGRAASAEQLRRMSRTLHAAASGTEEDAERLARGRLEKDIEPESDFGLGFGGGDDAPDEAPAIEAKKAPPKAKAAA
jgi:hypothetical protein